MSGARQAPPTTGPTSHPTSRAPTVSPTNHPTPHVCNTQLHSCDSVTMYCQAARNGSYTCECRQGYMPTSGSAPRCIETPRPTSPPSTHPTTPPSTHPTIAQPTAAPTMHPTLHACSTQLHGCDMLTTVCQGNTGGTVTYTCECRDGYTCAHRGKSILVRRFEAPHQRSHCTNQRSHSRNYRSNCHVHVIFKQPGWWYVIHDLYLG